ncbi:MAG: hypothetical protein AAF804_05135 [Bacteroidota bacterium]
MQNLFNALLAIHVVAGFGALILFWIPALNRKGGKAHRKIGKWYVGLMWAVVISAWSLCLLKTIKGQWVGASFLGFLGLITVQPLWYGIAVLKEKKEVSLSTLRIRRAISGAVAIAGLAMIGAAIDLKFQGQAVLLLIFGILGATSIREVLKPLHKQQSKAHWYLDHLEGMIITGIAAHTAFFAFGGNQFLRGIFVDQWVAIPWVMPTVLGIIAIRRMKQKYRAKTQRPKKPMVAPQATLG